MADVQALFCTMLPDTRKYTALFDGFRASPFQARYLSNSGLANMRPSVTLIVPVIRLNVI